MTRTQNEEPTPPPPPTTQTNTSSRRAGSSKSRLAAVTNATRPKMNARALVSGPSGSGKTWTMLSIASVLVEPVVADERTILVIDTEKESALTYADNFTFRHLPWRPPYDPGELAEVLDAIPFDFPAVELVIVDSLTHFWRGTGGTLEIADGKFGGWKEARPVQDRLVEAMLTLPLHLLVGVRSKMEYLVGANGREVSKVGLAPVQSEDLVYEMNVALDLDMNHRIEVVKSRTPAVPVGRMYPAGTERKAAEDYAGWLAGGVPPAPMSEVEALKARLAGVVDKEARVAIKAEFVTTFGMPDSLTADQVDPANAWITMMLDALDDDEKPQTTQEATQDDAEGDGTDETTDHAAEPAEAATDAQATSAREELIAAEVESLKALSVKDLTDALAEAGLSVAGPTEAKRRRLANHLVAP
jgi:hypothetical protein